MKLRWTLKPKRRLGPFRLGASISSFVTSHGAVLNPCLSDSEDKHFTIPDSATSLIAQRGIVISVFSDDSCFYRGVEMVGLSISEAESTLGLPTSIEKWIEEDGVEYEYRDYDSIDLQVSTKNGVVSGVIVSNYDLDHSY